MSSTHCEKSDISRRAHQIYEERIRAKVEPEHIGEFIAVDVETGDWEMDAEALPALKRLKTQRREFVFLLRAGHHAAFDLSGYIQVKKP